MWHTDEDIERRKVRFQFLASVRQHPHRAWHLECSKMRSWTELFTKLEVAAQPLLDAIRLFMEDVAVMKAYAVLAAEDT